MAEALGPVITIDGTSGCGKGTLAQALARHLGWHYLDSGALYRIVAWAVLNQGLSPADEHAIAALVAGLPIRFSFSKEDETVFRVFCNETEVTEAIRTQNCANMASQVSAIPAVRKALFQKQLDFRQLPGLVTDGRDMGTVVFPDASLKIFLTASLEERANRRYRQLKGMGKGVSLPRVREELAERDTRDMQRSAAPLVPAEDAWILDTSLMNAEEVFHKILAHIHQKALFR